MILSNRPLALFAATALAAALSFSATHAQQAAPPSPPAQTQPQQPANDAASRMARRAEERAALMDRNLAQMKSSLQLKPEQEALWTPVEAAMRDLQRTSTEARERFRNERQAAGAGANVDPAARIRAMANMAAVRSSGLTRIADALDPLYKTFDDGQKQRFAQGLSGPYGGGWGPGGGMRDDRGGWRGHGDDDRGGYGRRWRDGGEDDRRGWRGRDDGDDRRYDRRWREDDGGGYGNRWQDERGYGSRRWRDEEGGYGYGRRWRDDERGGYGGRWRDDDRPRGRWD
ncbi:MAG: Spy/CpxP family protein refolding chaperone [Beijerinckiaceae bacterium]